MTGEGSFFPDPPVSQSYLESKSILRYHPVLEFNGNKNDFWLLFDDSDIVEKHRSRPLRKPQKPSEPEASSSKATVAASKPGFSNTFTETTSQSGFLRPKDESEVEQSLVSDKSLNKDRLADDPDGKQARLDRLTRGLEPVSKKKEITRERRRSRSRERRGSPGRERRRSRSRERRRSRSPRRRRSPVRDRRGSRGDKRRSRSREGRSRDRSRSRDRFRSSKDRERKRTSPSFRRKDSRSKRSSSSSSNASEGPKGKTEKAENSELLKKFAEKLQEKANKSSIMNKSLSSIRLSSRLEDTKHRRAEPVTPIVFSLKKAPVKAFPSTVLPQKVEDKTTTNIEPPKEKVAEPEPMELSEPSEEVSSAIQTSVPSSIQYAAPPLIPLPPPVSQILPPLVTGNLPASQALRVTDGVTVACAPTLYRDGKKAPVSTAVVALPPALQPPPALNVPPPAVSEPLFTSQPPSTMSQPPPMVGLPPPETSQPMEAPAITEMHQNLAAQAMGYAFMTQVHDSMVQSGQQNMNVPPPGFGSMMRVPPGPPPGLPQPGRGIRPGMMGPGHGPMMGGPGHYGPPGQFMGPPPHGPDSQFMGPPPYGPDGQFMGPPLHGRDGQFMGPPPFGPDGQFMGPPPHGPDGQFMGPPPHGPDGQFMGPPPHGPDGQFMGPQGPERHFMGPHEPEGPYMGPPPQGPEGPFMGPPPRMGPAKRPPFSSRDDAPVRNNITVTIASTESTSKTILSEQPAMTVSAAPKVVVKASSSSVNLISSTVEKDKPIPSTAEQSKTNSQTSSLNTAIPAAGIVGPTSSTSDKKKTPSKSLSYLSIPNFEKIEFVVGLIKFLQGRSSLREKIASLKTSPSNEYCVKNGLLCKVKKVPDEDVLTVVVPEDSNARKTVVTAFVLKYPDLDLEALIELFENTFQNMPMEDIEDVYEDESTRKSTLLRSIKSDFSTIKSITSCGTVVLQVDTRKHAAVGKPILTQNIVEVDKAKSNESSNKNVEKVTVAQIVDPKEIKPSESSGENAEKLKPAREVVAAEEAKPSKSSNKNVEKVTVAQIVDPKEVKPSESSGENAEKLKPAREVVAAEEAKPSKSSNKNVEGVLPTQKIVEVEEAKTAEKSSKNMEAGTNAQKIAKMVKEDSTESDAEELPHAKDIVEKTKPAESSDRNVETGTPAEILDAEEAKPENSNVSVEILVPIKKIEEAEEAKPDISNVNVEKLVPIKKIEEAEEANPDISNVNLEILVPIKKIEEAEEADLLESSNEHVEKVPLAPKVFDTEDTKPAEICIKAEEIVTPVQNIVDAEKTKPTESSEKHVETVTPVHKVVEALEAKPSEISNVNVEILIPTKKIDEAAEAELSESSNEHVEKVPLAQVFDTGNTKPAEICTEDVERVTPAQDIVGAEKTKTTAESSDKNLESVTPAEKILDAEEAKPSEISNLNAEVLIPTQNAVGPREVNLVESSDGTVGKVSPALHISDVEATKPAESSIEISEKVTHSQSTAGAEEMKPLETSEISVEKVTSTHQCADPAREEAVTLAEITKAERAIPADSSGENVEIVTPSLTMVDTEQAKPDESSIAEVTQVVLIGSSNRNVEEEKAQAYGNVGSDGQTCLVSEKKPEIVPDAIACKVTVGITPSSAEDPVLSEQDELDQEKPVLSETSKVMEKSDFTVDTTSEAASSADSDSMNDSPVVVENIPENKSNETDLSVEAKTCEDVVEIPCVSECIEPMETSKSLVETPKDETVAPVGCEEAANSREPSTFIVTETVTTKTDNFKCSSVKDHSSISENGTAEVIERVNRDNSIAVSPNQEPSTLLESPKVKEEAADSAFEKKCEPKSTASEEAEAVRPVPTDGVSSKVVEVQIKLEPMETSDIPAEKDEIKTQEDISLDLETPADESIVDPHDAPVQSQSIPEPEIQSSSSSAPCNTCDSSTPDIPGLNSSTKEVAALVKSEEVSVEIMKEPEFQPKPSTEEEFTNSKIDQVKSENVTDKKAPAAKPKFSKFKSTYELMKSMDFGEPEKLYEEPYALSIVNFEKLSFFASRLSEIQKSSDFASITTKMLFTPYNSADEFVMRSGLLCKRKDQQKFNVFIVLLKSTAVYREIVSALTEQYPDLEFNEFMSLIDSSFTYITPDEIKLLTEKIDQQVMHMKYEKFIEKCNIVNYEIVLCSSMLEQLRNYQKADSALVHRYNRLKANGGLDDSYILKYDIVCQFVGSLDFKVLLPNSQPDQIAIMYIVHETNHEQDLVKFLELLRATFTGVNASLIEKPIALCSVCHPPATATASSMVKVCEQKCPALKSLPPEVIFKMRQIQMTSSVFKSQIDLLTKGQSRQGSRYHLDSSLLCKAMTSGNEQVYRVVVSPSGLKEVVSLLHMTYHRKPLDEFVSFVQEFLVVTKEVCNAAFQECYICTKSKSPKTLVDAPKPQAPTKKDRDRGSDSEKKKLEVSHKGSPADCSKTPSGKIAKPKEREDTKKDAPSKPSSTKQVASSSKIAEPKATEPTLNVKEIVTPPPKTARGEKIRKDVARDLKKYNSVWGQELVDRIKYLLRLVPDRILSDTITYQRSCPELLRNIQDIGKGKPVKDAKELLCGGILFVLKSRTKPKIAVKTIKHINYLLITKMHSEAHSWNINKIHNIIGSTFDVNPSKEEVEATIDWFCHLCTKPETKKKKKKVYSSLDEQLEAFHKYLDTILDQAKAPKKVEERPKSTDNDEPVAEDDKIHQEIIEDLPKLNEIWGQEFGEKVKAVSLPLPAAVLHAVMAAQRECSELMKTIEALEAKPSDERFALCGGLLFVVKSKKKQMLVKIHVKPIKNINYILISNLHKKCHDWAVNRLQTTIGASFDVSPSREEVAVTIDWFCTECQKPDTKSKKKKTWQSLEDQLKDLNDTIDPSSLKSKDDEDEPEGIVDPTQEVPVTDVRVALAKLPNSVVNKIQQAQVHSNVLNTQIKLLENTEGPAKGKSHCLVMSLLCKLVEVGGKPVWRVMIPSDLLQNLVIDLHTVHYHDMIQEDFSEFLNMFMTVPEDMLNELFTNCALCLTTVRRMPTLCERGINEDNLRKTLANIAEMIDYVMKWQTECPQIAKIREGVKRCRQDVIEQYLLYKDVLFKLTGKCKGGKGPRCKIAVSLLPNALKEVIKGVHAFYHSSNPNQLMNLINTSFDVTTQKEVMLKTILEVCEICRKKSEADQQGDASTAADAKAGSAGRSAFDQGADEKPKNLDAAKDISGGANLQIKEELDLPVEIKAEAEESTPLGVLLLGRLCDQVIEESSNSSRALDSPVPDVTETKPSPVTRLPSLLNCTVLLKRCKYDPEILQDSKVASRKRKVDPKKPPSKRGRPPKSAKFAEEPESSGSESDSRSSLPKRKFVVYSSESETDDSSTSKKRKAPGSSSQKAKKPKK